MTDPALPLPQESADVSARDSAVNVESESFMETVRKYKEKFLNAAEHSSDSVPTKTQEFAAAEPVKPDYPAPAKTLIEQSTANFQQTQDEQIQSFAKMASQQAPAIIPEPVGSPSISKDASTFFSPEGKFLSFSSNAQPASNLINFLSSEKEKEILQRYTDVNAEGKLVLKVAQSDTQKVLYAAFGYEEGKELSNFVRYDQEGKSLNPGGQAEFFKAIATIDAMPKEECSMDKIAKIAAEAASQVPFSTMNRMEEMRKRLEAVSAIISGGESTNMDISKVIDEVMKAAVDASNRIATDLMEKAMAGQFNDNIAAGIEGKTLAHAATRMLEEQTLYRLTILGEEGGTSKLFIHAQMSDGATYPPNGNIAEANTVAAEFLKPMQVKQNAQLAAMAVALSIAGDGNHEKLQLAQLGPTASNANLTKLMQDNLSEAQILEFGKEARKLLNHDLSRNEFLGNTATIMVDRIEEVRSDSKKYIQEEEKNLAAVMHVIVAQMDFEKYRHEKNERNPVMEAPAAEIKMENGEPSFSKATNETITSSLQDRIKELGISGIAFAGDADNITTPAMTPAVAYHEIQKRKEQEHELSRSNRVKL